MPGFRIPASDWNGERVLVSNAPPPLPRVHVDDLNVDAAGPVINFRVKLEIRSAIEHAVMSTIDGIIVH